MTRPYPVTFAYTDFLVQRSLSLNMVFLEFIIEFFESFQVLDCDAHLLDFLSQNQGSVSFIEE